MKKTQGGREGGSAKNIKKAGRGWRDVDEEEEEGKKVGAKSGRIKEEIEQEIKS